MVPCHGEIHTASFFLTTGAQLEPEACLFFLGTRTQSWLISQLCCWYRAIMKLMMSKSLPNSMPRPVSATPTEDGLGGVGREKILKYSLSHLKPLHCLLRLSCATTGTKLWGPRELRNHSCTSKGQPFPCVQAQSCLTLCDPMDCNPPGKNTWVGWHFLLHGDLPNPEIKPYSTLPGGFFTTAPPRLPLLKGGWTERIKGNVQAREVCSRKSTTLILPPHVLTGLLSLLHFYSTQILSQCFCLYAQG